MVETKTFYVEDCNEPSPKISPAKKLFQCLCADCEDFETIRDKASGWCTRCEIFKLFTSLESN